MGSQGLGLEITELRLGLPGGGGGGGGGGSGGGGGGGSGEKKRAFSGSIHGGGGHGGGGCGKNRNMDEVVGWPPVCVFRKKCIREVTKLYVKVSIDGAPILRKIDLSCFKCYSDLGMALEKLFDCYGIGEAMKEESKSCEYVAIYEDKDGDWMLVGDVPWSMFTETCKRLRIKKRSNATGIGPLANV